MGAQISKLNLDYKSLIYASLIVSAYGCLSTIKNIRNSYNYFEKRGIPYLEYEYIFGNIRNVRRNQEGKLDSNVSKKLQKMEEKYGKNFGMFEGMTPVLVTSDLEIINEVFIKQFNNFHQRLQLPLESPETSERKSILMTNRHGKWKRFRLIMNPAFSSSKLRDMNSLIQSTTDRLIEKLNIEQGKEVEINSFLKLFTMDTIWNCAFGLDLDLQNNPENEYLKHCYGYFDSFEKAGILMLIAFIFPSTDKLLYYLACFIDKIMKTQFTEEGWILNKVSEIIDARQQIKLNRRDFMQLMLESMKDNFSRENDFKSPHELADLHIEKHLSRGEVEANLVIFMLAGYETTSTALTNSIHALAMNPDVQEKLYEEINENFGPDSEFKPNTDNVKDLHYLDNFIKEVLRVYPIVTFARKCSNETTIKGINIEQGVIVRVNQRSICFDKEHWGPVDPYLFDPTRHEVKRNPLAYVFFGLGPRNCVGMKFALIEMKLALVKLVLNFEITKSETTPINLLTKEGLVTRPELFNVSLKKRL